MEGNSFQFMLGKEYKDKEIFIQEFNSKMESTELSSSVTIEQFSEYKKEKNREKIADLIFERFQERYLEPFNNNQAKHGFSMMACGCLMIESLHCFKKGRKKTGEAGGVVFNDFFTTSQTLTEFSGYGSEFYTNIRCGILHQGETYGGWKIRRRGELFNKSEKIINATKFIKALEQELKYFTDSLRGSNFFRKPWVGVIRKLDYICKNCNA